MAGFLEPTAHFRRSADKSLSRLLGPDQLPRSPQFDSVARCRRTPCLCLGPLRGAFPQRLHRFGGTSAMGWSTPAAMGAKLAHPDKTVVNVTGDGSFGLTGMEIETAARNDIRTLTVILNNE